MPFSVIIPAMYFAGVTSKAGFFASLFSDAILTLTTFLFSSMPFMNKTSSWSLSSMGILFPSSVF